MQLYFISPWILYYIGQYMVYPYMAYPYMAYPYMVNYLFYF